MIRKRYACGCDCEDCPPGCGFMSLAQTDDERRAEGWVLQYVTAAAAFVWVCRPCAWNRIVQQAAS